MSKKMSGDTNALNWFEISVKDFSRAKKFYEKILEIEMTEMEMMGMKMAMFPNDGISGKVGGAIVQSENHIPSSAGTIVYLNASPELQKVLNRIEAAGGNILMPATLIDEQTGYMAMIADTEGNTVGLHALK